jgi:FkbM family methyltransferase
MFGSHARREKFVRMTVRINSWTYPLAWLVRQLTAQWWLPQNPRERLANGLFSRQRQAHFPFTIRLDGVRYRGDFGEYVDWRIFFLGGFERESLNLCRFLSSHAPGDVFVDVGAFRGLYALLLAPYFRQVVAFEPFAPNRERMIEALGNNKIENVEVRPVALGDLNGELDFQLSPRGTEGQGTLLVDRRTELPVVRVPVRRGDEELQALAGQVGLIKIDCEGYEKQVLSGLRHTLEQSRPFVLFEISDVTGSQFHSEQELSSSFPAGYDLFEVSDHSIARNFFLKPLSAGEFFTRAITNNLACPAERRAAINPYVRTDWRWASRRT